MNMNPLTWNVNETSAAGRNVLSYVAGGVTVLAAWGLFSQHDAAEITTNIDLVWNGIMQAAKGIAGLAAVVVPIYTALRAAHSASPSEQAKAVAGLPSAEVKQALATIPDTAGRNKIINATAELPEVRAIIGPESLAKMTESDKIVSTPAKAETLPLAVPRTT